MFTHRKPLLDLIMNFLLERYNFYDIAIFFVNRNKKIASQGVIKI